MNRSLSTTQSPLTGACSPFELVNQDLHQTLSHKTSICMLLVLNSTGSNINSSAGHVAEDITDPDAISVMDSSTWIRLNVRLCRLNGVHGR